MIPMGLPFALASYAHASSRRTTGTPTERPDSRRILVLWAGMPISLLVGALIMFAETGIMHAAGFGMENLPFEPFRRLLGEGAACLAWATCLLIWSHRSSLRLSRKRLVALSTSLFVCVVAAYCLSLLIFKNFHKDVYFLLTSVFASTLSALILVLLKSEPVDESGRLKSFFEA